jgi:hypothetical protein
MDLAQLNGALTDNSAVLGPLSVRQFLRFVDESRHLLTRISAASNRGIPDLTSGPPVLLPEEVVAFLASSLTLDEFQVQTLWWALRHEVWDIHKPPDTITAPLFQSPIQSFAIDGPRFGLSKPFDNSNDVYSCLAAAEHLYPSITTCTNPDCPPSRAQLARKLVEARSVKGTLYTMANGAYPVLLHSTRCRGCETTYYLNYCRRRDQEGNHWREYYGGLPALIQTEKHFVFENNLAELFRAYTVHSK